MDPRVEIMAKAWMGDSPFGDADVDAIKGWTAEQIAALEAAGYSVVKLEQAGWLNPRFTEPEDCPVGMGREPKEEWEGYTVPVYRIVESGNGDTEPRDALAVCSKCGYLPDTPNHHYGCREDANDE